MSYSVKGPNITIWRTIHYLSVAISYWNVILHLSDKRVTLASLYPFSLFSAHHRLGCFSLTEGVHSSHLGTELSRGAWAPNTALLRTPHQGPTPDTELKRTGKLKRDPTPTCQAGAFFGGPEFGNVNNYMRLASDLGSGLSTNSLAVMTTVNYKGDTSTYHFMRWLWGLKENIFKKDNAWNTVNFQ